MQPSSKRFYSACGEWPRRSAAAARLPPRMSSTKAGAFKSIHELGIRPDRSSVRQRGMGLQFFIDESSNHRTIDLLHYLGRSAGLACHRSHLCNDLFHPVGRADVIGSLLESGSLVDQFAALGQQGDNVAVDIVNVRADFFDCAVHDFHVGISERTALDCVAKGTLTGCGGRCLLGCATFLCAALQAVMVMLCDVFREPAYQGNGIGRRIFWGLHIRYVDSS